MTILLNLIEEDYDEEKGKACLNDYDWSEKEDDGKGVNE